MCSIIKAGVRGEPTFIEAARRAQIVQCASDAIDELGFERASLAEIAKRAGISKSVISYMRRSSRCSTRQHANRARPQKGQAMRDFKHKVAVITGAASGIGRGLADRFATEGIRVVIADVEEAALAEAEREMTAAGATVLAVRTDVSRREDVEALARKTIDRFGAVHIVCNNAGVGDRGGLAWDASIEEWEWVLGVNLWGVIHGVRTFVPLMLRHGEEAHIVNTASVAGLLAGAGGSRYTTTKFGVVGLSEALHYELAYASGGKVGVSVLCPGMVNTRILESGRNYPAGPIEEPAAGAPERMMFDMIKTAFKGGMAPSEVADEVFDAIVNQRFYVITHPEHNPRVRQRAEAIASGAPPPTIAP